MSNKRLIVFDLLKIFLSYLVINLHVESFVTGAPFSPLYFLGWYAVPIFVTLSFYFGAKVYLSDKSSYEYFWKKLTRFLIPFIFWSIVGFIVHPELLTFKYVFRQILTGTAVDPPLYYLSTIVIVSFLIYLCRKILFNSKKILVLTILVLLIVETSGLEKTISGLIPIQIQLACIRIFEFTKYALLGILLSSYRDQIIRFTKRFWLLLLSVVLVTTNTIYLWYFQIGDLSYSGITQFVVIVMIIITSISYSSMSIGSKLDKTINELGGLTLGVYCLHTFFIEKITLTLSHGYLSAIIFGLSLLISIIIRSSWNGKLRSVVS